MMLRHVLPFVVSIPVFAFAACGGSTDSSSNNAAQPSGTGDDSGVTTTAPADAGVADNGPDPIDPTYPTKHPALPLVDFNGGSILTAPHIIPITVDGDTMRADLEKFSSIITTTKWWDAVRNGYCDNSGNCVGQGDSGDPVHLATTDFTTTSFTDSSQGGAATLQTWITSMIDSGKFPAPTPNTLYAIFLPSDSYTVNLDGSTSCGEFGGYHNSYAYPGVAGDDAGTAAIGGMTIQYALVPRCGDEEITTVATSHEFIEAATDPHVGSGTAYYMQDQLWSLEGGEVGDLCVTQDNSDEYTESGFSVQRIWSNVAAKGSHDPCVPAPAGDVYFNVAPANEQFTAKVGATKTIVLTAFSDAPTPNWTISGVDYAQEFEGTQSLQFAFDKTIVNNGTKVNMTITVVAAPPSDFQGAALFSIRSTQGTVKQRWPGAVIVNSAQ
jgi:hypothetical protein